MSDSIRDRRVQYETAGLDVADLDADPIAQWQRWHDEALEAGVAEPNAMTLSTIGIDGTPDSRIVLVRGLDARGLVFYTNYDGAKSQQLDANPVASATFGWLDLHRQVRVRGPVERVSAEESDTYFSSRPRASQLGAWSSPQSDEIADRSIDLLCFAPVIDRPGSRDSFFHGRTRAVRACSIACCMSVPTNSRFFCILAFVRTST